MARTLTISPKSCIPPKNTDTEIFATNFSNEITPDDRACFSCYKSHLVTIQQLNSQSQSVDQDLKKLLDKIEEDIPEVSDINTMESAISYSCYVTTICR